MDEALYSTIFNSEVAVFWMYGARKTFQWIHVGGMLYTVVEASYVALADMWIRGLVSTPRCVAWTERTFWMITIYILEFHFD